MTLQPTVAPPSVRGFTGDDGPGLARMAGEAQAGRRGGALRPGLRPVHTCGVGVEGVFRPTGAAGPSAPDFLLSALPVPVVARFSSCDARAEPDDRRPGPRGLAVRFDLEGGGRADLVMMSTDRFPVSTRSAFRSVAAAMSTRSPLKFVRLFLLGLVRQFNSPLRFLAIFSPASYARLDYYALHTFVWSGPGAGGAGRPVRYRWRAEEGKLRTRPWTRLFKHRQYLRSELEGRMDRGGVRFRLEVQLPAGVGAARLRDPGRPLPRGIPWSDVGELHLTRVLAPAEQEDLDRWLFSPAHLPAGVQPYPGDEIFIARAAAYPASHVFRNGGSP